MADTVVSGNQVTRNKTFNNGDRLYVGPNGSADYATLNSGSLATITNSPYGIHDSTVNNGASLVLSSGGFGTTTKVNGGNVTVSSGGTYNYNWTNAGGTVTVLNGGTAWTNFVSGQNAAVIISSGGFGSDARVGSDGRYSVGSGGRLSGANVGSGGTLYAIGGSIATATISAGGTAFIQNGGTLTSATVDGGTLFLNGTDPTNNTIFTSNGGTVYLNNNYRNTTSWGNISSNTTFAVNSGGQLFGGTVLQGGVIRVNEGGKLTSATLNGGTLNLNGANATSNTTFGTSGGTVNLFSGYSNTVAWQNITSNTRFNVLSGAIFSGTNVLSGATVNVASGGSLTGTLSVNPGGTVVLNGTAGSGTVNLSGDGSQLTISGTQMPTNVISGWSPTDKIDLASIPYGSITSVTTTESGVTFHTANGSYSLNIPGANKYGYALNKDSDGSTIYTTCFAEGTHITTEEGDIAVENLKIGTQIHTPNGLMPLKWLGHRSITVAKQKHPEDNWLVRIRRGAFAEGTPARDLLVTQEHCMVFDGRLVPARMLVNNRSVIVDRSINSYTYYHVELESHAAIWAEKTLTESYLDTGNRDQFENNTVVSLSPRRRTGGSVTLPLDTSRDFVEPIFRSIAERAGVAGATSQHGMTCDPDLHLLTETGEVIRPRRISGEQHVFFLPDTIEHVKIMSRSSRPSDVVGPYVDDRRDLGVLIGQMKLFGANKTTSIEVPSSPVELSGWYDCSAETGRWTNGAATLFVGPARNNEPRILTLQILSQGHYRIESEQGTAATA
ncbi:outer membrane protein [Neokomagataea thailandica NBRC 106555]|nr:MULTISPECIES: Hint domain-containing protein [Neokomagataea]GBR54009.1 outer membrane protein [Neokomagataea thailandica NBRC 106555]